MLGQADYRALAQITNTTWGSPSTSKAPTVSIKMQLVDADAAVVSYTTVFTFQGMLDQQTQQREFDAAQQAIDAYLKEVKREFKKLTGRAIKLKLVDLEPSVELIDVNSFSPLQTVRTAYFRCTGEVELG